MEDAKLDRAIIDELEKRQQFREQNIPFRDEHLIQQITQLPEALQPRLEGLTEEEFRIYELFGANGLPAVAASSSNNTSTTASK